MPRDGLIVLLVVGVALNILLVVAVAWANRRAAPAERSLEPGDPGAPVAADDTDPARLLRLGAGLVDRDWIDTHLPEPEPAAAQRAAELRDAAVATPPGADAPVVPEAANHGGPRRRHRARRPAGAVTPRTDLLLSLGEPAPDGRLVEAVSTALRDTLRASDQLVELPDGRLRITLQADAPGGDAFVRRARSMLRPWLGVIQPGLELSFERGRRASETASG